MNTYNLKLTVALIIINSRTYSITNAIINKQDVFLYNQPYPFTVCLKVSRVIRIHYADASFDRCKFLKTTREWVVIRANACEKYSVVRR